MIYPQSRVRQSTLLKAVLLSVVLVLSFVTSTTQDLPTFRIGIIDAERGRLALGAQFAVEQINANGGVRGADGTIFQLELVIQAPDANGDITTALANLQQAETIAVLGPADTNTVINNLAALQALGVPVITPALGDTILASDGSGLLFRSRAAEFLQGRALATYLIEDIRANNIVTVQLDIDSTAGIVGFSTAAAAIGVPVRQNLLFVQGTDIVTLVNNILGATPEVAVVYGAPSVAASVYLQLRQRGWRGIFTHNLADHAEFRTRIPLAELDGILSTTTWSFANRNTSSQRFVLDYSQTTGIVPGAIEAATFDSLNLIRLALGQPGVLAENMARLDSIKGVQGVLSPNQLARGETSDNVSVVRLNALGGEVVVAQFAGTTRIPVESVVDDGGEVLPIATDAPTGTPTLDGVYVLIRSETQNVRTGPGLEYEILGQLRRGDLERVVGANLDFSWVVINFRGTQGWLSTAPNLLQVLGDRRTVPVVNPPPVPTPRPATGTPPPLDIADIVITAAGPSELPVNSTVAVTITMRNVGGLAAGPFAVAASFAPNNFYAAQNFAGLPGFTDQQFTLTFNTPAQTGNFETVIVADLNQQVNEGAAGEANNSTFIYRYRLDRPYLQNTVSIPSGGTLDLDLNGTADINYTAGGINTMLSCTGAAYCVGLISPPLNWETAHYDAITAAGGVSTSGIISGLLVPGATIGVLTDSGKRAVIRVDSVNVGVALALTYRTY
jgi:ABC-type branched-subunit amino acid transport system substrate-binding protein